MIAAFARRIRGETAALTLIPLPNIPTVTHVATVTTVITATTAITAIATTTANSTTLATIATNILKTGTFNTKSINSHAKPNVKLDTKPNAIPNAKPSAKPSAQSNAKPNNAQSNVESSMRKNTRGAGQIDQSNGCVDVATVTIDSSYTTEWKLFSLAEKRAVFRSHRS